MHAHLHGFGSFWCLCVLKLESVPNIHFDLLIIIIWVCACVYVCVYVSMCVYTHMQAYIHAFGRVQLGACMHSLHTKLGVKYIITKQLRTHFFSERLMSL